MMSLMLGLPYAVNDDHFDMRVNGKDIWENKSVETFMLKGAVVAGMVTDRLLNPKQSSFASAMEVDQIMDKLASDLPQDYWTIPPSSTIDSAKTLVEWQVQVLTQLCFHQVRVYLHMPFMLQSATNSRYDYSRRACLDGAREMLRLYHTLRTGGFSVYQCKVVDFVGFTASIILILGLLGYGRLSSHDAQRDERDWQLIETSMEIFKEAASEKGGRVADQSYHTLKQFWQVRNYEGQGPDDNPDCISKISIPCKSIPQKRVLQYIQLTYVVQTLAPYPSLGAKSSTTSLLLAPRQPPHLATARILPSPPLLHRFRGLTPVHRPQLHRPTATPLSPTNIKPSPQRQTICPQWTLSLRMMLASTCHLEACSSR